MFFCKANIFSCNLKTPQERILENTNNRLIICRANNIKRDSSKGFLTQSLLLYLEEHAYSSHLHQKSALYGFVSATFILNVFPLFNTLTTWDIMLIRCKVGCLLNNT